MLRDESLRIQLHQLRCACGDARVLIQNFGEGHGQGWISIGCMGIGCEEEEMLWFDSEQEAIDAWAKKYGIEKDFLITYRNGDRIKTPIEAPAVQERSKDDIDVWIGNMFGGNWNGKEIDFMCNQCRGDVVLAILDRGYLGQ